MALAKKGKKSGLIGVIALGGAYVAYRYFLGLSGIQVRFRNLNFSKINVLTTTMNVYMDVTNPSSVGAVTVRNVVGVVKFNGSDVGFIEALGSDTTIAPNGKTTLEIPVHFSNTSIGQQIATMLSGNPTGLKLQIDYQVVTNVASITGTQLIPISL